MERQPVTTFNYILTAFVLRLSVWRPDTPGTFRHCIGTGKHRLGGSRAPAAFGGQQTTRSPPGDQQDSTKETTKRPP